MTQQINLLQRKATPKLAAAWALGALGAVFALCVAYGGSVTHHKQTLQAKVEANDARIAELRQSMAKAQTVAAGQNSAKSLETEILDLKGRADGFAPLLASMHRAEAGSPAGYTTHFLTLARVVQDDVWVTGAEVTAAGTQMSVSGRALRNEAVAHYARRLNEAFRPMNVNFSSIDLKAEPLPNSQAPATSPGQAAPAVPMAVVFKLS